MPHFGCKRPLLRVIVPPLTISMPTGIVAPPGQPFGKFGCKLKGSAEITVTTQNGETLAYNPIQTSAGPYFFGIKADTSLITQITFSGYGLPVVVTAIFLRFWKPRNEWHFTEPAPAATPAPLDAHPPTGAHAAEGAVGAVWTADGGPTSYLGYPTNDLTCKLSSGGCRQTSII